MIDIENVLIVEDTPSWCDIFERACDRNELPHRTAHTLDQAREILRDMAFAVAIVDVRLDEEDDQNSDGLHVLGLINKAKDPTSSFVITGHGNLDIGRDAVQKYGASYAIKKADVGPELLREYLLRGRSMYRERVAATPVSSYQFMRGDRMAWDWEDEVLRAVRPKGGVSVLYPFLDELFQGFYPALHDVTYMDARVLPEFQVVAGRYWSRAIGHAVMVVFGERERLAIAVPTDLSGGLLARDECRADGVLNRVSSQNLTGVVLDLGVDGRDQFEPLL